MEKVELPKVGFAVELEAIPDFPADRPPVISGGARCWGSGFNLDVDLVLFHADGIRVAPLLGLHSLTLAAGECRPWTDVAPLVWPKRLQPGRYGLLAQAWVSGPGGSSCAEKAVCFEILPPAGD